MKFNAITRTGFETSFDNTGGAGIATRYGLDAPGIESRWEERFSAPFQAGPGAHLDSYTMGTVKRPGRGVDHPPHLAPRIKKKRLEMYMYSPSAPSWPVPG